jgi:hypothetical protein
MTRRIIVNLAVALSGAFALAVAFPAFACDCDKKTDAKPATDKKADKAAPATKDAKPAQDKKTDAATATGLLLAGADACPCGAKEAKDCKCGDKCKCHEKKAGDKQDKPKASAASATGTLLAAACNCGAKDAKDCKCGEKCKCTEKKPDAAPKAKAA